MRLSSLFLAALALSAGALNASTCPCAQDLPASYSGLAHAGDIILGYNGNGELIGFRPSTGAFYQFGQAPLNGFGSMVVDPSDPSGMFCIGATNGDLRRVDGSGSVSAVIGSTGQAGNWLMGAASPLDGSLWFPDQNANQVWRFAPGGATAAVISPQGASNLLQASSIAFDGSQNLYIASAGPGDLKKITPDQQGLLTPTATVFVGTIPTLLPLVYDGSGFFYTNQLIATPTHSSKIWQIGISPASVTVVVDVFSPLTENAGGPLYHPGPIVADMDGNLWVGEAHVPGAVNPGLLELNPQLTPVQYITIPTSVGTANTAGEGVLSMQVFGIKQPRRCVAAQATPTPYPNLGQSPVLYPSPAKRDVWVAWEQKKAGKALVSLYRADGRRASRAELSAGPGQKRLRFDLAGFAPGPYLCRIAWSYDDGGKEESKTTRFAVTP